jgi:hypothetical protein
MDLMARAERLGEEGKVDESMNLMEHANDLRRRRSAPMPQMAMVKLLLLFISFHISYLICFHFIFLSFSFV